MKVISLHNSVDTLENVEQFIRDWQDESPVITQQTSGSTGAPKTISIPKWKMEESAKMTGKFFGLKDAKTALICISPNYIGGKMMIVRSLMYKLDLYVTDVTMNPLENLTFPIDFVAMVPLQVEETIKQNPEKLNLVKQLIIGGAPVSDSLREQLSIFSCDAYSTFGMTETVSHIALRKLGKEDEPYRVIGNTKVETEDDQLVISCENLKIERLKTTDIVEIIDKKTFKWLGRADFVINSGGVKIHPEEVERKIEKQLGSSEFIISQLPDETLGSKVIFIGEENLKSEDLQQKVEEVVSKYERPKAYFFLPSLVRTANDKVDRRKTRDAIL